MHFFKSISIITALCVVVMATPVLQDTDELLLKRSVGHITFNGSLDVDGTGPAPGCERARFKMELADRPNILAANGLAGTYNSGEQVESWTADRNLTRETDSVPVADASHTALICLQPNCQHASTRLVKRATRGIYACSQKDPPHSDHALLSLPESMVFLGLHIQNKVDSRQTQNKIDMYPASGVETAAERGLLSVVTKSE
ncbi:hypothetical protein C8R44DRAFT_752252 [Mycena epipterygia]|nr:hypothetical protein C8R44DRAFT_752252 [Mycena epipterygia]